MLVDHHIADHQFTWAHTQRMSHGQRLVALRARVGHDPEQVSLRIGDQQVAHMAQAHDPVGFVERGIASNRDECDVLEIGHDRQCRRSGIHPGAHGRLGEETGDASREPGQR